MPISKFSFSLFFALFSGWLPLSVPAQQDAVIVTATRFPESALAAPIGMTVIGERQIRASTAADLPSLLAQEAGIVVRDTTGSPDKQVDLRGFGAAADQNSVIMVNGRRLNEIELVTIRWSAIPLESVERVEILRGSGAVLYGAGATGGAINIITRGVTPGAKGARLRASSGSLGARELSGGLSIADDRLGVAVRFSDQSADNYRLNNRFVQKNIDGEVKLFGVGRHLVLDFGLEDQQLRLPGARTQAQLASDPRGTANPNDFAARDGARLGLSGSVALDSMDLSADISWRDSVRTSFQTGTYLDTRSRVLAMSPRARFHHEFFGLRGSLVVGADLEDWEYESKRAGSLEALRTPTARILASQENRAYFLQNHSQLTQATKLSLGMRHQQVEMTAVDRVNAAAYARGRKKSTPRAWEVGFAHELNPSSTLHGRIGQSFRINTVDESYAQFGGPAGDAIVALLEPQTSRDHEMGYRYRSGATRFRSSVFFNDLKNEIHFYSPTFSNINLPPTRRTGIELDGAMPIASTLAVFANLSGIQAKFKDGILGGVNLKGKSIPLVPREKASLGLSWNPTEVTQFNAALNHVGKQRYDNDQANTFPKLMPGYETVDLKLSHRIRDVTVRASINNLFDRNYYSYAIRNGAGTSFNAYPQAGRTTSLALEFAL